MKSMAKSSKPYNYGKGKGIAWLRENVKHRGNKCLIWPFARINGYGTFGYQGKVLYAHRIMCELLHGPAPSRSYDASHSCGNGHKGCCNPRHLTWKTKSANQLDRAAHGTKNIWSWSGKITQADADEIRALKGIIPQREIAAQFGISRSNVSFIHCNKAWTGKPHKYSAFQRRVVHD